MNNDSYLDPDIHLCAGCPDDVCYYCGYKFPADVEIEDGTAMWEGFCSNECMEDSKNKKPIPCIRPMYKFLCDELGRDDPYGWSKSVYKGTNCGAWLRLDGDDCLSLGSIVEGSDFGVGPEQLNWPFTSEQFWKTLEEIEREAEFYWERDNSRWIKVAYTPVGKDAESFHLRERWGDYEWDGNPPAYVINKVQDFLNNDGELEINKPRGICLGVQLTEYYNDITY